jgi:hypothetical protein
MLTNEQELPIDLISEQQAAKEKDEAPLTWRNRRLRGEGPPYYRPPGTKKIFYSRREIARYYARHRHVPPVTAVKQGP